MRWTNEQGTAERTPSGELRTAGEEPAKRQAEGGKPGERLLEAAGITKTYRRGVWPLAKELNVLKGADVHLAAGQIVGLVGENGSGKSTLMKILVGSLDRDGGTITYHGNLGYCPQEPVLYERLTCVEHFHLFARAYGLSDAELANSRTAIYDTLGFKRLLKWSC